ncbi:MAG: helix-turn-helix domain-containing protein [Actinomycetota bacterium]|nr:helix-turn-helix domain-containing protein [Actinomycetota bacterium]
MADSDRRPWTFLTSHARVLILISQNPDSRVRDLADLAGITERSTQRIIVELEEDGYLTHDKVGRRNHYNLSTTATLRHPHERTVEIGLLLDLFKNTGDDTPTIRTLA